MKSWGVGVFAFSALALTCVLGACGIVGGGRSCTGDRPLGRLEQGQGLSPAQEHAGEIMAYLLRVVLGQAGPMVSRKKWAAVGLTGPLELDDVYRAMTDSGHNIWEVMPIDTNLLPLSQVLFHYDDSLSFSKGKSGWMSLYPAPEFLAIRMLLLRKIHRGEKIRLGPLLERESLLFQKGAVPAPKDLRAMNLSAEEWRLIGQVVEREPVLYRYLMSPFLVKSLHQAGAVERDAFVGKMMRKASYRAYPCLKRRRGEGEDPIRIAILPSMTRGYSYGGSDGQENPYGFRAKEELLRAIEGLEKGIENCARKSLEAWVLTLQSAGKRPKNGQDWQRLCRETVEETLSFCVQDQRPLAIYPGCTEQVIREVCPDADFAVILIGKDIYLALSQDDESRPSGRVGWAYVDMDDVERGRMSGLCEEIAGGILERLKRHIRAALEDTPHSSERPRPDRVIWEGFPLTGAPFQDKRVPQKCGRP